MWVTPDGEGWRMRFEPPLSDVPMGWTPLYGKPMPPSVPDGYQIVDTALLQRASQTIGQFIDGYDWAQEDMDCMDDLDAHLCRAITTPPSIDAHELWAAAQLTPGEGIEDGVDRIAALLATAPKPGEG